MSHNNIIKPEREEVPQIIDAALLAKAAAGQEKGMWRTEHHNTPGVIPGLHRRMHQLLDQFRDSFSTQMEAAGIEIGRLQISWRPVGSEQDAYENLIRSQLVFRLQRLPMRQPELSIVRKTPALRAGD